MATYHQSQLGSWAECPARVGYDMLGLPRQQNSFMAFGSTVHVAAEELERGIVEVRRQYARGTAEYARAWADAVDSAVETFLFYWNPQHIEAVCEPVPADGWATGHGYNELRTKGADALRKYAEILRIDDSELLATEFGFNVPIDGTWDDELGEPHRLAGTADRVAAEQRRGVEGLLTGDFKTGRIAEGLRHNLQFTAYSYASTKREYWVGDRGEDGFGPERGEELYQRFLGKPRRNVWISFKTFKLIDAGYRGPVDYERFAILVNQIHASITADIFPLSISGQRCRYCEFRRGCAGTGVPDAKHGDPFASV